MTANPSAYDIALNVPREWKYVNDTEEWSLVNHLAIMKDDNAFIRDALNVKASEVASLLMQAGRAVRRLEFFKNCTRLAHTNTQKSGIYKILTHNSIRAAIDRIRRLHVGYRGRWIDILTMPAFTQYVAAELVVLQRVLVTSKTPPEWLALLTPELIETVTEFFNPLQVLTSENLQAFVIGMICKATKMLPKEVKKALTPTETLMRRTMITQRYWTHVAPAKDPSLNPRSRCPVLHGCTYAYCFHHLLVIEAGSCAIYHRFELKSRSFNLYEIVKEAHDALESTHKGLWDSILSNQNYEVYAHEGDMIYDVPLLEAKELYVESGLTRTGVLPKSSNVAGTVVVTARSKRDFVPQTINIKRRKAELLQESGFKVGKKRKKAESLEKSDSEMISTKRKKAESSV